MAVEREANRTASRLHCIKKLGFPDNDRIATSPIARFKLQRKLCLYSLCSGVGGGQGYDAGASHALQEGRLGVGQLQEIVYAGHSGPSDHTVQFSLNFRHHVGVAQHEHVHPQERRLDRLHAGREEIGHHLHDLLVCAGRGRV